MIFHRIAKFMVFPQVLKEVYNMRTVNGEYLVSIHIINKEVIFGQDMKMAVWIDGDENIRYDYWFEIQLPKFYQVLL